MLRTLTKTSYNSVVFQTIAANDVDFLVINEAFLTTRGGWRNSISDLGHDYYQSLQDTLLDGQYLDRSRFENISATDCFSRYTAPFIRAGNGFAVVPTVWSNDIYYNNNSLRRVDRGSG
jgi:hypothetical protein